MLYLRPIKETHQNSTTKLFNLLLEHLQYDVSTSYTNKHLYLKKTNEFFRVYLDPLDHLESQENQVVK